MPSRRKSEQEAAGCEGGVGVAWSGRQPQGRTNVPRGAGRRRVGWARFCPGEGGLCERAACAAGSPGRRLGARRRSWRGQRCPVSCGGLAGGWGAGAGDLTATCSWRESGPAGMCASAIPQPAPTPRPPSAGSGPRPPVAPTPQEGRAPRPRPRRPSRPRRLLSRPRRVA